MKNLNISFYFLLLIGKKNSILLAPCSEGKKV
jgi:hypothetical protein